MSEEAAEVTLQTWINNGGLKQLVNSMASSQKSIDTLNEQRRISSETLLEPTGPVDPDNLWPHQK